MTRLIRSTRVVTSGLQRLFSAQDAGWSTSCLARKYVFRGNYELLLQRTLSSTLSRNYSSTPFVADTDKQENSEKEPSNILVYESPYCAMVLRLRTISLLTGFGGAFGLPIAMASKVGGPDPMDVGFWLLSATFGFGTLSTTAAVTYIFSTYCFTVHKIPVRKCHYKKEHSQDEEEQNQVKRTTPYLYMATTRSILLFKREYVFDPEKELHPYSGFIHPLCNLKIINDSTPAATAKPLAHLYLHPEQVSDLPLRKVLARDPKNGISAFPPENPDTQLTRKSSREQ